MQFEIKSTNELSFVKGNGIYPSVEVNMDSLEEAGRLDAISELEISLEEFAKSGALASIYVLETPSANFGRMCNSIFFGVAGSKSILEIIHTYFSNITNVDVRFSEYIPKNKSQLALHIEFGTTWTAYEEGAWRSASPTGITDLVIDCGPNEDTSDDAFDDLAIEEDPELVEIKKTTSSLRQRAARSDAKVGTIRRTIEEIFGLPTGSVQLCNPDGRKLKGNALIRTLRNRWE